MSISTFVALLALSPVVAASQGRQDVVSMVQQRSHVSEPPASAQFSVGDHVLLSSVGEGGGKEFTKADITGRGTEKDTYNVHVWVGKPSSRDHLNVPVELLMDAKSLELQEAAEREAQKKAEMDQKFKNWLAGAQRVRAARLAKEQHQAAQRYEAYVQGLTEQTKARIEDYHRRTKEEEQLAVERKAAEEARAKAAEEEKKRREEEEEARREEEEAEKAKVERQKNIKVRWESLKAAKLKAAGAADAPRDVQRGVLMSERFKQQQRELADRRHKAKVKAAKAAALARVQK